MRSQAKLIRPLRVPLLKSNRRHTATYSLKHNFYIQQKSSPIILSIDIINGFPVQEFYILAIKYT